MVEKVYKYREEEAPKWFWEAVAEGIVTATTIYINGVPQEACKVRSESGVTVYAKGEDITPEKLGIYA